MIQEIGALNYLSALIQRGGEMERIELRPCSKPGTEKTGEWTYRDFADSTGNIIVVLYYWKGPNECDRQEVRLKFPKTHEDQEAFSAKIAESIGKIRKQGLV
jgi:hypothetical protein